MGFLCHPQQRIALSHFASTILENDCILFGCVDKHSGKPSKHAFINRVFCNSFDRSDASIGMRLAEKEEYYRNLSHKSNSEEIEHFVNSILKNEKKKLAEKAAVLLSANYASSSTISLNNDTIGILAVSTENVYYPKGPSKYIRAVVEEYASCDQLVREEIFYRKTIEKLETYASDSAVIDIRLIDKPRHHQVIPAFIRPDIYKTHLYLAGVSVQENRKGEAVSYRLDRIESIQYIRRGTMSSLSLSNLEKAIDQRGIQYLTGAKSHIRIRLTPGGIRKYQRYTYQRPICSSIEGDAKDIYIFDISEYQAQVYFFKFGADAVVLEPETLRQTFHRMYRRALAGYDSP